MALPAAGSLALEGLHKCLHIYLYQESRNSLEPWESKDQDTTIRKLTGSWKYTILTIQRKLQSSPPCEFKTYIKT